MSKIYKKSFQNMLCGKTGMGLSHSISCRCALMLTMLLTLCCVSAYAESHLGKDYFTCGNFGFYIIYQWDNETQTVIETQTVMINSKEDCNPVGRVEIPSSVEYNGKTYTVTELSYLSNWNLMTELVIPNTILKVNSTAFKGCTGLESLILEDGDEVLKLLCDINGAHLFKDTPLRDLYIGRPVDMEESSIYYSASAFYDKETIKSVTFGESVTAINKGMFKKCSGLSQVKLPASLTTIEEYAFSDCSSLQSISLPESVTTIGEWAFSQCSSLRSIYLPNSVKSIGVGSFYHCTSLSGLWLSESMEEIPNSSFSGCKSLVRLTIPTSVKKLGDYAFASCGIKELYIPDNVESFESDTFQFCRSLVKVVIGNGIRSIPDYAFYSVWTDYTKPQLEEFIIGKSVTSIGKKVLAINEFGPKIISYAEPAPEFLSSDKHSVSTSFEFFTWRPLLYVTPLASKKSMYFYWGPMGINGNGFDIKEIQEVESITITCQKINNILLATATVLPETATDKTVIWTSSDSDVLWVDSYGIVLPIGVGDASIIATANDGSGVSAEYRVRVLPVLIESITLDPSEWAGEVGESFHINASILPENASNKTLEWTSDNDEVASVDEDGNVTVHTEGTCLITARTTDGSDLSATCIISGSTLVQSIVESDEHTIELYNLQGVYVKSSTQEELPYNLTPGVYILRKGNEVKKIIVK